MNISDKTSTIWSKEERMQWKAFWNSPKESDHPRAYEVAGNLIKQVAEVTEKLGDLQEKMKKLKEDLKKTNTVVEFTKDNTMTLFILLRM